MDERGMDEQGAQAVTGPVLETTEARPGVLLVRLNRPRALNALNTELVEGLREVLGRIQDDSRVRAVVLTGAGRGFCAGLDLKGYGEIPGAPEAGEGTTQAGMRLQQRIADLADGFRRVRAPIIAAVNGPAAGAGLSISLFCDIRIAAASATFHASYIQRGLGGCDIGVSWTLPRLIGFSRAADLLLTGGSFDAAQAERIGLVSEVVPDDGLLDTALDKASAITAHSPFAVWMTKEVLWSNLEIPSFRAALDLENRNQILCSTTADHQEAVAAFLEKRPAVYTDR
ncbi:enoyl-CoA hydratase/isomerase family protein [Parafrankia sp. EUN1f]|uniref:enoyl-CoA hydratase/isomerase family protein n=2 Tax=Parafrankia sp. EUN1f TaxID=102897 RepID=UPI001E387344|nr:enoyl-CoA hydratase-related protein [Parafrankia sp. EUN1f]